MRLVVCLCWVSSQTLVGIFTTATLALLTIHFTVAVKLIIIKVTVIRLCMNKCCYNYQRANYSNNSFLENISFNFSIMKHLIQHSHGEVNGALSRHMFLHNGISEALSKLNYFLIRRSCDFHSLSSGILEFCKYSSSILSFGEHDS